MNLLFDILYAAHANGTHHKLAMDALNHLSGEQSERRRNIILKHHEAYLRGSKDPDKKFRDFRNHVLHVEQNYWGGAEKAARKWYDLLVESIRSGQWNQAAYHAGVVSHYYTDPLMPFHTGQSEAENNIHRAAEWSISCAYNRLRAAAELRGLPGVRMPSGGDWLEQMVREGAEKSHTHYQTLIDHYNFKLGRRKPERGLDVVCRDICTELIGHAISGFSKILNRAFDEAANQPPYVLLVAETVVATLEIPIQWVTQRMENAQEAELVRQMFREYQKSGKVERHLTEDVRAIRDELAADLRREHPTEDDSLSLHQVPQLPEVSLASLKLVGTRSMPKPKPTPTKPEPKIEDKPTPPRVTIPLPQIEPEPKLKVKPPEPKQSESTPVLLPSKGITIRPKVSPAEVEAVKLEPPERTEDKPHRTEKSLPPVVHLTRPERKPEQVFEPKKEPKPTPAVQEKKPVDDERPLKFYLDWTDPVVEAPSIGNKTAKRLGAVGIKTVAQLISADPKTIAPRLKAKHITPKLMTEWQSQAILAYRIPMLRGHDAQLLTGCGYETPEDVAAASAKELLEEVLEYAETNDGQRILRSSGPPDLAEVTDWIAWAKKARRAQAA
ncbi:DUF4332 domain-containing protein [bacterium]|nr:DUF4332 domain-containing protein [bacterium]